jgi:hypothetical protein
LRGNKFSNNALAALRIPRAGDARWRSPASLAVRLQPATEADMTRQAIVFGILTLMAVTGVSDAQPRRADGGACGSTGTARKTGTDQQGNKLDCLWDTCTFTECGSSGGQISNCVQKTEYSNARDCKAAARQGTKGTRFPGVKNGTNLLKQ